MKTNKQGGLIKMIILIIIAVSVLGYFGVDIKDFFNSPQVKTNLGYIWNFVSDIWTNYLTEPATKLWGIWLEHFWGPFMNMLETDSHTDVLTP